MSMLLAEPSARLRSWMGAILDRGGDLCVRAGAALFALRERVDPVWHELTPEAADRILAGVKARIATEAQR